MSNCILATQKASQDGYVRTTIGGIKKYAHRLAYEHKNGSIEAGMTIDHICKTKNCINVEHLEVVTRAENTRRRFIGQTHCKNGHPYSGENLIYRNEYKRCKKCYLSGKREYNRRYCAV